jgi:hypothetical protein
MSVIWVGAVCNSTFATYTSFILQPLGFSELLALNLQPSGFPEVGSVSTCNINTKDLLLLLEALGFERFAPDDGSDSVFNFPSRRPAAA